MSGMTTSSVLKIALLDDHDVVRHGSFVHLSANPRFHVVGSHAHSSALVATLETQAVDVAVVDYSLSNRDLQGAVLLRMLQRRFPLVRLLLFSAHANRVTISGAIAAGASGVVGKSESLDGLTNGVLRVAEGHLHLPADYRNEQEEGSLSPSEREVLQLCLSGLSVTEIAIQRHRSIKTISTQKHAAFRKLGLRTDRDLFTLRHQLASL